MFRCAFYLWKAWLTYIYRNSTCYENPNNPSCIDHILTKWSKEFFKNRTVFTGLSDFDKLILSVFKLNFSKAKTKEISYKDFKRFREDNFNRNFQNRLSVQSVEEYAHFEKFFVEVLNKHAPLKKKGLFVQIMHLI